MNSETINEELAGPPPAPVAAAARLPSLDVLRGFALLGILMANIQDFASPTGILHDAWKSSPGEAGPSKLRLPGVDGHIPIRAREVWSSGPANTEKGEANELRWGHYSSYGNEMPVTRPTPNAGSSHLVPPDADCGADRPPARSSSPMP